MGYINYNEGFSAGASGYVVPPHISYRASNPGKVPKEPDAHIRAQRYLDGWADGRVARNTYYKPIEGE